jgi:hypothetical protein
MKRSLLFVVLAAALALSSAGCSASRSAVASEADMVTAAQIEEMLAARLYKADFTRAYPASAPSFPLNYPYFISVIDDRVESFLPYFGRAYMLPYGGGEGLRFEGPISDYTQSVGKKGQREITFSVRTGEDEYDFTLTVWPTGECNLTIMPMNKQSISFSGEIDLDPEFEAVRRME